MKMLFLRMVSGIDFGSTKINLIDFDFLNFVVEIYKFSEANFHLYIEEIKE
jgi:hypothetical protein